MKKETLVASAIAAAGVAALAFLAIPKNDPLETVNFVDLEQYLGKWYEIARFPQSFEKGCACSTAEYSLNDDGSIKVLNSCARNGQYETVEGIAHVTDKKTNSKLNVRFGIFSGKYWIIALASDYSYAMVGHPNRKYLWLLSRKSGMDSQTYNYLLERAVSKGFDVRKLVRTVHDCAGEISQV